MFQKVRKDQQGKRGRDREREQEKFTQMFVCMDRWTDR